MAKLKAWIKATRPKTVLLSITSIMLGGFLSASEPTFYLLTLVFAALTALLLQILSNFANDYGDFKKGLDDDDRVGPQRALQSGEVTEKQMQICIIVTAFLSLICGAILILFCARLTWKEMAVFACLGIFSILSALFYTLGKHPYGYYGLGDLFIFLFFGLIAVCGTYYLVTKTFDFRVLLPATAMGFLSVAGMNINNTRDYENDKAKGKNTMVVKMGLKMAFIYHCLLIGGAFVCLTIYLVLHQAVWYSYLFWLLFPLFLKDLIAIKKTKPELLDPFLGRQVKLSFLLVLVYGTLLVI